MSVIAPGTYVEDNTRIVHYEADMAEEYATYEKHLKTLRDVGCTITPLAYNDPHNSRILLYIPTSDILPARAASTDIAVNYLSRWQVVTSLYNMYSAGFYFNISYKRLRTLSISMICTQNNIAMTSMLPDSNTPFTVFGVPYYMLCSELFTRPIVKSYIDDPPKDSQIKFSALKLIAFLVAKFYRIEVEPDRFSVEDEGYNGRWKITARYDKFFGQDDYLRYAKYLMDRISAEMFGNTFYSDDVAKVQNISRNAVIASKSSIVYF